VMRTASSVAASKRCGLRRVSHGSAT
jgi:hypothetical protein